MKQPKRTWLFIFGVAVLALAGVPKSARADGGGNGNLIHACVKGAGVRIVGPTDLCMPNETSLHWNITGPQGSQGNQGPKGDDGPEGLQGPGAVVRDSQGAYVGALLRITKTGSSNPILVLRQDMDTAVAFELNEAGLIQNEIGFEFESNDCTGQKLFGKEGGTFAEGIILGTTVYYEPEALLPPLITHSSSRSPRTAGMCIQDNEFFIMPDICCAVRDGGSDNLGPVRMFDLSDLVPPFHVEVQE